MKNILFAKRFVKFILEDDAFFSRIIGNKGIDFIALTGSVSVGDNDEQSDFDLFLILSRDNQRKFKLRPIYEFQFENVKIEISVVSREKLIKGTTNKKDLYWWYNCKIIKTYNKEVMKYFKKASIISKDELRDRLWTNWVSFEINRNSIDSLIKRNELLGISILFNDNVKLVVDSFLTVKKIFIHSKWQGQSIKKTNKLLYDDLLRMNNQIDENTVLKYNSILRNYLFSLLEKFGFKKEELDNWSTGNLDWLIFQYS